MAKAYVRSAGYLGEFAVGQVVDIMFNTLDGDETLSTVGGSPSFLVYTAGNNISVGSSTFSEDMDGITGLHRLQIDTSSSPENYVDGDYAVVFDGGTVGVENLTGAVVGLFSINSRGDISNSVATLLAAQTNVTVTSTVHGNAIEVVRGSSYNTTTGRTVAIPIAGDNWPTDLTSWTITMDCMQTHDSSHNPPASPDSATGISGTVTQATGDSRAVRIDLTTTITSGLTPGWYKYYVEATNGSNRTTLRTGVLHVVDDDPTS
jgi:hypothetical protein